MMRIFIMPNRVIPKNYRNITGKVVSLKDASPHGFESGLERDFYTLLDFDLNVQHYDEQPITLGFNDCNGQRRQYTPDVLVFFRTDVDSSSGETWLCEIKYREDLFANWKTYKPKFRAAMRYAAEMDWRFKIMTEKEIHTPFLDNAKFLKRYTALRPENKHYVLCSELARCKYSTPADLLRRCENNKWKRAELAPYLWHFITNRTIGSDLTRPLTMQSEIWTLEG